MSTRTKARASPHQLKLPLAHRRSRSVPVLPAEYRQRMTWLRDLVSVRAWRWQSTETARMQTRLTAMLYGDAMRCLHWRLERERLAGSYAQWMLYYQDALVGVIDVRSDETLPMMRAALARYLVAMGWRSAWCVVLPGEAVSDETMNATDAMRLFK